MWNRFISSPYAHLATAVAVTFGLVLVVLTVDPKRNGLADAGGSARRAPAALASSSNVRTGAAVDASGIRRVRDDGVTGRSP